MLAVVASHFESRMNRATGLVERVQRGFETIGERRNDRLSVFRELQLFSDEIETVLNCGFRCLTGANADLGLDVDVLEALELNAGANADGS